MRVPQSFKSRLIEAIRPLQSDHAAS